MSCGYGYVNGYNSYNTNATYSKPVRSIVVILLTTVLSMSSKVFSFRINLHRPLPK